MCVCVQVMAWELNAAVPYVVYVTVILRYTFVTTLQCTNIPGGSAENWGDSMTGNRLQYIGVLYPCL